MGGPACTKGILDNNGNMGSAAHRLSGSSFALLATTTAASDGFREMYDDLKDEDKATFLKLSDDICEWGDKMRDWQAIIERWDTATHAQMVTMAKKYIKYKSDGTYDDEKK
jgi:hypothetical protein